MDDYKPTIVAALETLMKKDQLEKRFFQVKAYKNVLEQLKMIKHPVRTMNDLASVNAAGKKIHEKFKEILETGSLKSADRVRSEFPMELYDTLQKIYGVGPVKAKDLVEKEKIVSIAHLRDQLAKNPKLLNDNQKVGLRYYEDINERIPRAEMEKHAAILMATIPSTLQGTIVGSYRRNAASSGDIDMLLKGSSGFKEYVAALKANGYIQEVLAEGDKKCLAVCSLAGTNKGRRLDLLVSPAHEYAYAILYFTGSDVFNVAMRSYALTKGYTLNEHTLTPLTTQLATPAVPPMESEKDIFNFLGLVYIAPEDRKSEEQIIPVQKVKIRIKRTVKN